jgi:hypothetical protein
VEDFAVSYRYATNAKVSGAREFTPKFSQPIMCSLGGVLADMPPVEPARDKRRPRAVCDPSPI